MTEVDSFFAYQGRMGMSIARSCPKWFKGPVYKPLAPPWELINAYKRGDINSTQYVEFYKRDVLDKLDKEEVRKDVRGYVLLCWEKGTDFCHRYIVQDWLDNIKELDQ
jgi:hypothetical protein